MKNKKGDQLNNVVDLEKIRADKKPNTAQVLKDTKKAIRAIATSTCLICRTKKACVNKTGVCASCYDTVLTAEEKIIASQEAKHKKIKILVTDDRCKE